MKILLKIKRINLINILNLMNIFFLKMNKLQYSKNNEI